jgi:hypothetical protein
VYALGSYHKIAPNGPANSRVEIDWVGSFQALTKVPDGKGVHFQVVIIGKGLGKEIEKSLELRLHCKDEPPPEPINENMIHRLGPCLLDYPNAPKLKTKRDGDTVTVDFTIPHTRIGAGDPALVFTLFGKGTEATSYAVYYAVLKEFL